MLAKIGRAALASAHILSLLRLVEKVQKASLKAKPEVGIQFETGGATAAAELETEGTRDPEWAI